MNNGVDVRGMNSLRNVALETQKMERRLDDSEGGNDRIILGLLNSVENDGARSQRHFAAELGIALGLVNAYLNRCIKKGFVKASQAPARRYAYYLTPKGFAEKSRLSVEYLSSSFGFFRQAKADCVTVLQLAEQRKLTKLAILGVSDLAEIAAICAIETDIMLVAVIDPSSKFSRFVGLPVVAGFGDVDGKIDGVLITSLTRSAVIDSIVAEATSMLGSDAILVPKLADLRPRKPVDSVAS